MSAEMKMEGVDAILDLLKRQNKNVVRIGNKAILAGAEVIRGAIARHARRSNINKEHLADNITISKVKTVGGVKVVWIGPTKGDNSRFFYGKFLEWGTLKMVARPFVGPGAAESKKDALKATIAVLRDAAK